MKRGTVHICVFLIYLILVAVMYTPVVFADFRADIHGSDNVLNFRRSTYDVTIINVSASIPGQTVSPSQIKVISDPTRIFDCNQAADALLCQITIPGDLPPGLSIYEIQLFNSDLSEAAPKIPLSIHSDAMPPTIQKFSLYRNGSKIFASYQVSDSACISCPPAECAGVSKIDFLLDYSLVGQVFTVSDSCPLPLNATELKIDPTPGTSTKTICMNAYDRLGQESTSCQDIVMDFSAPILINASLWLNNYELKYTKGEPIQSVQLRAIISDESALNTSSLVADLSALNARPEFSKVYKYIDTSLVNQYLFKPACMNLSQGLFQCNWSNLLVVIPDSNPVVYISITDNLTNKMNSSYTIPILYDNVKPIVTAYRSGIADERNAYWVGKSNNTLLVDLAESGSGFNDKKLLLDVSSFGKQHLAGDNTILTPNSCIGSWTCEYDYVNVTTSHKSGDVLKTVILTGSSDDANNIVEGPTTGGFFFDGEAPQILSVMNSTICPTNPGTIDIVINVSEQYSGGVKATFNAPSLSTDVFPQVADCVESETRGIWTCDITISNLYSFYVDGTINVTLEDRAGNKNTTTLNQEVCESAPGSPPNVVSTVSNVSKYPETGIDRMVGGKIPFPLFWKPDPQFYAGMSVIQGITIDGCSVSNGTASDVYMVTPLDFKSPLFGLKVAIDPSALSVTNLIQPTSVKVNCQLEMIIRSGTKVYQLPQILNVTFDVPLYDTLYGELNQSMYDKFMSINQSIIDKESEIHSMQKWIDFAGWFCSVAELTAKIAAFLQALKIALYIAGWAVFLVSWIFTSAEAAMKLGGSIYFYPCYISDVYSTIVITNLWQVDSNPFSAFDSPGYYIKLMCAFFTCRFTEESSFIELWGNAFRANGALASGKVDGQTLNASQNSIDRQTVSGKPDKGDVWAPVVGAGDARFSAYRSLPIARNVLCGPAILYGLKKERQVLCMQRNCYRDLVSAGFTPDICDRMYAGQECLYVDGAAYKAVDDASLNKFWKGLMNYLLNSAYTSLQAMGMRASGCPYPWGLTMLGENIKQAKTYCGQEPTLALTVGAAALGCGAWLMTLIYFDIGDWLSWDDFRNKYSNSLGSPDYCSM